MSIIADDNPPTLDNGFANKPTPEEEKFLNRLYDGNRASAPAAPNAPLAADRMYGPSMLEAALKGQQGERHDVLSEDTAAHQQRRTTYLQLEKSGLPEAFLVDLAKRQHEREVAAARPHADPDATDFEQATRIQDANEALREDFRVRGEADLLERVQRFVRSHEPLAKILQQHGLGSDRTIVESLSALVFSTGWR